MRIDAAHREDADALAAIFTGARRTAMPWLPEIHTDDDDRRFIARVIAECDVLVARGGSTPVGFLALGDDMVEHLYVAPARQRAGIGSALLEAAKTRRPAGLRLWVFQRNNGAGNEEREPDVLLAWPGRRLD